MSKRSVFGPVLLSLFTIACEAQFETTLREGDALVFRGEYTRALKAYEAALLEMQEVGAAGVSRRCETLLKVGGIRQGFMEDLEGALRAYRSAAACPDERVVREARLFAARLYRHRLHDPKSASRELAQLLQLEPQGAADPAILFEAASHAFAAAEYDRARELAALVIARGEGTLRARARELQASVLLLEDRWPEALVVMESLRSETPDAHRGAALAFETARLLEKLGRFEDAKARYEAAKSGAPSEAWLAARLEKLEEAAAREKDPAPGGGGRVSAGTSIRH